MSIDPAEVLASILDEQDAGAKPEAITEQGAANAARRKVINKEATMRLDLDAYLREKFKENGNRWRLFKAVATLEDLINQHYCLSEAQVKLFRDDLEDLVDAGIPDLMGTMYEDQVRNTSRIILRVMYQDDYKRFADDMMEKFDI